jgi:hypothetical protein
VSLVQLGTQSLALQIDPAAQPVLPTQATHCRELGSHISPGQSAAVEHSTHSPLCVSQVRPREQSMLLAHARSQLCVATTHLRPV